MMSEAEARAYMTRNAQYFEASDTETLVYQIVKSGFNIGELEILTFKSPKLAAVLSVTLGWLGVDRFYSGNYIMGIIKLLTFGGSAIWWIIDWFLIKEAVKCKNRDKLYAFLTGRTQATSINMDTVKNVVQSKEVRDSAVELIKSGRDVMGTFDIND